MNRDIYGLIEKMIDKKVKGADTYINNGSRWLIFTDEKKWIFELTKEGTLWYNYYFFENIFKIISLNVVDNQHHITKWVENFIRNGVKDTGAGVLHLPSKVEDTIQNGVKHTDWCQIGTSTSIEDAIQNGVKETKHNPFEDGLAMEEAIQNGIKETTPGGYLGSVEMKGKMVHQFETAKQLNYVEDVINDSIKEVKELPDKSGGLMGHGEYYARKENRTYPHDDIVNDVICDGIKQTKYCELHSLMRADHIIRDGVKETNWRKVDNFPEFEERVIENGIKETWGYEKQPQVRVNEVINKGEKTIWNNNSNKL